MPTSTLSKPSTSQAFFSMQEYRCTANKNKKRQNRHTYRHIDERKLLCHKMENIFCCTYSTVRSGYIIQAIRDGNVDIVTSIPLEKETPAALREKKGRVKRWKTLQTWLGVSGTDLRSAFPFFFYPTYPTRVFDNRRVARSFRPYVHSIRSPRLSFRTIRADNLLDSSI